MSWLDSLAIDGTTIPAWRTVKGLAGSPPPRQDLRDRSRRHGSIDRTEFYQPRMIEVDSAVLKGDPSDIFVALDVLKSAFALGTDHVLKFRRRGQATDERVLAKVAAELTADLAYDTQGVILWSVPLLAADPRIYNDTVTTARYSPSAADGGLSFPLTFPLVFSGGSGASLMTVTNGGNFWTPAAFTVDGPADAGFSVVNETTGEELVTQGIALAEGDSITIDVDAREVTVAGTSRPDLINAAQTTWLELKAGDNWLRLHGSGFEDGVTALTVSYRDARI